MSKLLDDLASPGPTGPQHQPSRKAYPDGWQPRSEVDDTDGGFVVSTPAPASAPQSHAEILETFGLKVEDWTVERVRRSRWQKFDGEWLESQRISILPRRATEAARVDMDKLTEEIAGYEPDLLYVNADGGSFVAPMGDLQIGKVDGGGTAATVQRVLAEQSRGLSSFLRFNIRDKVRFEQVVLPQLGDCVEGVNSQGGSLVKRTDLGLTEMVRVYRRLLWNQVKMYAEHSRVLVPAIGGNHGQAIRINNSDASWGSDNWDLEAASAVQDAVLENPELRDRVSFLFPERDSLTVAFEASGTVVGLAHGHQFKGGWNKWWSGQASGRTPVGDADVLLAGHLHHLHVQDFGGHRLFVQVPALDGGSEWFAGMTGERSRSRSITFWVRDGRVYDLDNVL